MIPEDDPEDLGAPCLSLQRILLGINMMGPLSVTSNLPPVAISGTAA